MPTQTPNASHSTAPRCVFLIQEGQGLTDDDALAVEPLEARGWQVDAVAWSDPHVDWSNYQTVVIRSTWDYHRLPQAFLDALARIERAGVRLENPLPLVRWNLHKSYLRDLSERGVPIVPTHWQDGLGDGEIHGILDALGCNELVVKPQVGASAEDTFRVDRNSARESLADIEARFEGRPVMVQPLVQGIIDEGEFSLMYFGGRYSHTVLKQVGSGDFRVQKEHGGTTVEHIAGRRLRSAGDAVLAALDSVPLYARVDLVRATDDSGFWLMELELIEPELFLRSDPEAPERFAEAMIAV